MLRQRVELNLGTATELDPVTHLADPRPGQPGITCSAPAAPAALPRLAADSRSSYPGPEYATARSRHIRSSSCN